MRPAAITLNYSVKNIQNDIHQILYVGKIVIQLTSVGLAHAHPNYLLKRTCRLWSSTRKMHFKLVQTSLQVGGGYIHHSPAVGLHEIMPNTTLFNSDKLHMN